MLRLRSGALAGSSAAPSRLYPFAPFSLLPRRHIVGAKAAGNDIQSASSGRPANPGFDDIVLDDELYASLGMTKEQAMNSRPWAVDELDPEGYDLDGTEDDGMQGPLSDRGASSGYQDERLSMLDSRIFGPEAVLLAGFRAEEIGVVRATIDSAGGHVVKVIPCTEEMLHGTLEAALYTDEVDWSQPRPAAWIRGGSWGSQRTVLFSGMGVQAQATVLELLDQGGLPHACASMAYEEDAGRRLGEVLAQAVKEHRQMGGTSMTTAQPKKDSAAWATSLSPDHIVKNESDGLGSLEALLGDKARARAKTMTSEAPATPMPASSYRNGSKAPKPAASFDGLGGVDMGTQTGGQDLADYFMNELPGIGEVTLEIDDTPTDDSSGPQNGAAAAAAAEGEEEEEETSEQRILKMLDAEGKRAESRRVPRQPSQAKPATGMSSPTTDAGSAAEVGGSQANLTEVLLPTVPPGPGNTRAGVVVDEGYASNASASTARASWVPPPPPKTQPVPGPQPAVASIPDFDSSLDDLFGFGAGDMPEWVSNDTAAAGAVVGALGTKDLWQLDDCEPEDSVTKTLLRRVQAALKAGVSIDELLVALEDEVAPDSAAAAAAAAPAAAKQKLPPIMGPQKPPAPPPVDDPMFMMRPQARKALEGKNVRFMDLSKMPKKHRDNVANQLRARQEAATAAKRAKVEQQQQHLKELKEEHEALQERYKYLQAMKDAKQAEQQAPPPTAAAASQSSSTTSASRSSAPSSQPSPSLTSSSYAPAPATRPSSPAAATSTTSGTDTSTTSGTATSTTSGTDTSTTSGTSASTTARARVPAPDIRGGLGASSSDGFGASSISGFGASGIGGTAASGAGLETEADFLDEEDAFDGDEDGEDSNDFEEFRKLEAAFRKAQALGDSSGEGGDEGEDFDPAYKGEYEGMYEGEDGDEGEDEDEGEDRDEGEDGEAGEGQPVLTTTTLSLLVEAARAAGLDVERALAEAIAVGVFIPPDVATEVGVLLPSVAMIKEAILTIQTEYAELTAAGGEHDFDDGMADPAAGSETSTNTVDADFADVRVEEEMTAGGRVLYKSPPTAPQKKAWGAGWGARKPAAAAGAVRQEVRREGGVSEDRSSPVAEVKAGGSGEVQGAGAGTARGGRAGVMTRAQLAAIAERQGVPLEQLLEDARSKGVEIPDE